VFTFSLAAFAFIKAAQEFFKSQVEKARMRSIDVGALRELMKSKEKFEDDIEDLKKADNIQKADINRIEAEFKDIIKKFMEYQFKNFDEHLK
jgi:seryl-tRNA synthetase